MRPTLGSVVSWLTVCAVSVGPSLVHAQTPSINASTNAAIPYVPTHHDVVRDLLWLADVRTNDVVYDLGSGDGRVVIAAVRDFRARKAVGIEIDPQLVAESRANAAKAGVTDKVQFIHGDLFTNDFSQASVAVLYLGHRPNLDLRAKLVRSLKPGARVVSHQFGMGEWTPDKTLDVRSAILGMYGEEHNSFAANPDVPDFATPFSRMNHDSVRAWIVPAPIAGIWRGKLSADWGDGELTLTLHQRLSGVNGSFQLQAKTNSVGYVQADLWGTKLRLHCQPGTGFQGPSAIWFEGHANGDILKGTIWISQPQGIRTFEWTGRRQKIDLAGTWEWPGPKNSPVQMNIQRQDGRLAATYLDKNREVPMYVDANKPMPVTDFYDFGGGFYFTLLLGLEKNGSRRMGPDDGWLVGNAIVTNACLNGTIAFYPYPDYPLADSNRPALKAGKREWNAGRK